ncbi:MAG: AAA family ATPase [Methylophilaceae bacterium]|nr:AAA family ATPase [Methylophilaceae bacterium]
MFNFRSLELVHWDFWQRFSLPLDTQIITIVGPNGSGKTTLLDALRTLLGWIARASAITNAMCAAPMNPLPGYVRWWITAALPINAIHFFRLWRTKSRWPAASANKAAIGNANI